MQELIPLQLQTINGNAIETVSARELHAFLGSKRQLTDWIKKRIGDYDFVENQDFIKLHKKWSFPVSGKRLLITLSKKTLMTVAPCFYDFV